MPDTPWIASPPSVPPQDEKPLAGIGVWITRPRHQSESLAVRIRAMGGDPVRLPLMDIRGVDDPRPVREILKEIGRFHIGIFVSANAVEWGLSLLGRHRVGLGSLILVLQLPRLLRAK